MHFNTAVALELTRAEQPQRRLCQEHRVALLMVLDELDDASHAAAELLE